VVGIKGKEGPMSLSQGFWQNGFYLKSSTYFMKQGRVFSQF
jgi:hypothetical protein